MKGITKRQLQLLQFIWNYLQEYFYQPNTWEMMAELKLSSPGSITDHLMALEKKGYVKGKHQSRAVIFTEKGLDAVSAFKTPCPKCGGSPKLISFFKCVPCNKFFR